MTFRILRINLAKPLRKQLLEHTKSSVAKEIGVSPQKLNSMINDDWDYITRDAIERAADYLELTAAQVFEFVPVDFWQPIEQAKTCTFLRGSQEAGKGEPELRIQRYDNEATGAIEMFLHDNFPTFEEAIIADHRLGEKDLLKRAKNENCIVIGSPKSNAATEILLSHFFGAVPFDSSLENRRKIPFGFCWQDSSQAAQGSSLSCSAIARKQSRGRPGIALKPGIHVTADYYDADQYFKWQTKSGLDCGLVFVANKPLGTEQSVKLIVLAGFSGIGTLAAAKALVQDFRYLEQLDNESCVYGVVQARYRKSAHTGVRKFRDFSWSYRKGGYWPIIGERN